MSRAGINWRQERMNWRKLLREVWVIAGGFVNWPMRFSGRLYIMGIVAVISILSCNHIRTGSSLSSSDRLRIQKLGLLDSGETIVTFYSEMSNDVAGNFYTDRRIASYWLDKDHPDRTRISTALYSDIVSIDTVYHPGATWAPYMLITKKDSTSFKVVAEGKDAELHAFFDGAMARWKEAISGPLPVIECTEGDDGLWIYTLTQSRKNGDVACMETSRADYLPSEKPDTLLNNRLSATQVKAVDAFLSQFDNHKSDCAISTSLTREITVRRAGKVRTLRGVCDDEAPDYFALRRTLFGAAADGK